MTNSFEKKDKILTVFFSAIPIMLTGLGFGLINWRGPWNGKWALPGILFIGGFFGWILIIGAVDRQYNLKTGSSLVAQNSFLIYGIGIIGLSAGFIIAQHCNYDPFSWAIGLAIIGSFWGFALSLYRRTGATLGIAISVATAFFIWTVIALYFSKMDYLYCSLIGVMGSVCIGFVGGIIGPVVYQVRHSDVKLDWI